jgi:hypothetical protein
MFSLALAAFRRARDEGYIDLTLTNGCDMLGRIAVDQLDQDARMIPVVGAKQLEQESRRQRREDADLDMSLLGTPDRGDIPGAVVNLLENDTRAPEKALPGER